MWIFSASDRLWSLTHTQPLPDDLWILTTFLTHTFTISAYSI